MAESEPTRSNLRWPRALLAVAAIAAVGLAVIYGANFALTHLHNVRRSALVGIVTPLFFVALIALAWVLRQLQRRNII